MDWVLVLVILAVIALIIWIVKNLVGYMPRRRR